MLVKKRVFVAADGVAVPAMLLLAAFLAIAEHRNPGILNPDGSASAPESVVGAAAGSLFGSSVAVSGDTMAVGAPKDGDERGGPGAVYVFRLVGEAWEPTAKLTPEDAPVDGLFGHSVSLSGDLLIAGAPGGPGNRGTFYVYRFREGTWLLQDRLSVESVASGSAGT